MRPQGRIMLSTQTRVLILDQFQDHLTTLVHTMSMYGCEVKGTTAADEALLLMSQWTPHMVIVESGHPEIPAWRFAFEVRALRGEFRPYVVCLADRFVKRDEVMAFECGADIVETKPIYASQLRKWLNIAEDSIEDSLDKNDFDNDGFEV
jgi:DNA-binding response OmpR family regulator